MKLWLAAACAAATLCAQTSARIEGRITSKHGPLRGEVIVVSQDGPVRINPFLTDAEGQFAISVGAGRVLLIAKADGYVSEERELSARAGTANPVVHFVLSPAGSVSGRVYDENGAGVAGARVWVDYRGETRRWRIAEEAGGEPADTFGYFTIPVVAQERPFVLHADCEGWLISSSGTLQLRGAEMPGVVLLLSRHGTRVRGRVIDPSGGPLGGTEVRLRALAAQGEFTPEQRGSPAFARHANRSTVSAADGSYVFAGVPAGEVVVTAGAGKQRASGRAPTAAGRDTEIILTLR